LFNPKSHLLNQITNCKSMKKYLLVLLSAFCVHFLTAQERTVSGKITDAESGETIPGANVIEKGTTNGTVTDFDGNYRLSVSEGATLTVSFVGYASQEIVVGSRSVIDVQLALDIQSLTEVVVIGYGEVEQADATGAVAAVSAKDFNQGLIASPEQLIAGKTAGVQISGNSGAPGDGVQLRIRGTNSIRSNNNPLFVVDGVPLAGGVQPGSADVGFGTSGDINPLNFINPNDIESISILKDASATAIYGSRGANGVVIITTKSGEGSKGAFQFNSSVSISSPANEYDLLERDAFLDAVAQFGGDRTAQDFGENTDWQDFVTRTSVSHTQNLTYTKGFSNGSMLASLGYDDQQGILENSFMKRLTGRVNGSRSFLDERLNVNVSSTFSNVRREDPPISGSAGFQGDILGAAYSANPTWPTDPDFDAGGQRSPANMLEYYRSDGRTNRILANITADYELAESLTAKLTYGIDYSDAETVTLVSGDALNAGNGVQDFGQGQINRNYYTNNLFEATLNHNKQYGAVEVDFIAGYSVQSFRNNYYWTNGRGFADFDFDNMEQELRDSYDAIQDIVEDQYGIVNNWGASDVGLNGSDESGFVSGIEDGSLAQSFFSKPAGASVEAIIANFYDQTDYIQSYFARGNFTIAEKYLITATIRADGSSKFGEDERYGIFPSGAVAWKLHEEAFMPDFFSTFKLRGSLGIVGNQDGLGFGEFIRRERWGDAGTIDNRTINVPGSVTQGSVNPALRWEETTQAGVGIDFGILAGRITGTFDVYNYQTTDLLLRRAAAQPAVAAQIFDNLDATVENKGWEATLTYNVYTTPDASISITGNIARNDNLLTDFGGQLEAGTIRGQGLSLAFAQILAGGQPLFSYFLREFEGFDANGQPIGDNQTFVGKSALPVWNAGLSLNASYKNWSLSAYGYGQYGMYVYNNTANAFFTAGAINNARNVTTDVPGSGEAGSAEAAVSTRFLEEGDFFRLQNLIIGYDVPLSGQGFISNLNVNLTMQNLFLITDYSGVDPEVSTNPANFDLLNGLPTAGIDYSAYPRPRVFTIGISANF
jgi:iron complex outermembrane receptor protein